MGPGDRAGPAGATDEPDHVVRVAVDVPALADQGRELDYLLAGDVTVGAMVRVPIQGRRVAGWVIAVDVEPPEGVRLQRVAKVSGVGPATDIVELTAWAAWRWAGRRTAFLRAASPDAMVRGLPGGPAPLARPVADGLAREALSAGEAVVRLPPATDPVELIAGLTPALVVVPSVGAARQMVAGLRRLGQPAVSLPEGWARAAAGGVTVVGARAAVWAPAPGARAVVVVDAHDDALVEERAPAWSAWPAAAERARRAGIPCVLISPCPLLEQLRWGRLIQPPRAVERQGWAAIEVVDQRTSDPRAGLLGARLVPVLREATLERRVVCVLNRTGRTRLLACRACGTVTVCEHCSGAMAAETPGELRCRRCGRARPPICLECGSSALRAVRIGVSRLRDDVEALARLPVGEVTATVAELPATPVLVGTTAVLSRAAHAGAGIGAVVFVDFDQHLLAPRYRAAEEAMALLARGARLVGGRSGGRVLVQTRQPRHPVLEAAVRGDPGRLVDDELALRTELQLPPVVALATLSGDTEVCAELAGRLEGRVEVTGPVGDRWLLRAPTHAALCDALAAAGRPAGVGNDRLRIDVDPLDV